jgi:ABC-2 type transport system permease protein
MEHPLARRTSLTITLSATLAMTKARVQQLRRYPGWLLLDIVLPIIFAALPILMGRALAGDAVAENFELNTGSAQYVAFLIIGGNIFALVSGAMWNIGFWVRREQQTGTLEALYLTPTSRAVMVAGVALYQAVRGLFTSTIAYVAGCLLFGVNPFVGNVFLAYLFLLIGLIPLYGLSFFFGALVLRLKEANALIGLMQWVISFLIGAFFPVAFFPRFLQAIALAFPPTWMTNGVRASLLNVGYFFQEWYLDFAMLCIFAMALPLIGFWVYSVTERSIQRNQGVGQF